jgi:hypothetical protein
LGYETCKANLMQPTLETPSMPSYPNPSAEIDSHYVDARDELEHVVSYRTTLPRFRVGDGGAGSAATGLCAGRIRCLSPMWPSGTGFSAS